MAAFDIASLEGLLGLGSIGGGLLSQAGAFGALGELADTTFNYDPDTGEYGGAAAQIGRDINDNGAFTGYGVTGPIGTAGVDAQGNVNLQATGAQAGLQNQLESGAQGFFSQATQGIDSSTNDIYEALRATQRPGEDRQRLELENRLAAQGRSGVRSNMYGGTPEQLAMEKALAEADNSAYYQARGQALGEQGQAAQLGSQFMQGSYAPQAALLNLLQGGSTGYGFADVQGRQNQSLMSEALFSGLNTSLGARLGQANLLGSLGSGLTSGGFGFLSSLASAGTP